MNYLKDIFISIYNHFSDNPEKIIYWLFGAGGSGGIVYYFIRYLRNRPRLKISIKDYGLLPDQTAEPEKFALKFEAENIGNPTSLAASVKVSGFLPKGEGQFTKGEKLKRYRKFTYIFTINEQDRFLPSFQPKLFTATKTFNHNERLKAEALLFLWFITYTFTPTKGRKKRIHLRSADETVLSFPQYLKELACYVFFGKLPPFDEEKFIDS